MMNTCQILTFFNTKPQFGSDAEVTMHNGVALAAAPTREITIEAEKLNRDP